MTMTRLWTIIGVIAVIVILAGGYAVGVGPALTAASDSDTQLTDVELQNTVKQAELTRLKDLDADSAELFAKLGDLQLAIPSTHNTSVFAAQLAAIAAASNVTLSRVAYVSAEPALAPEAPAAPAAPIDPAAGDEAPTGTDAPAEVAPGSEANTQTVSSVPGLVALAVAIDVQGSDLDIHKFLDNAQKAIRAFSVSTVGFDSGTDSGLFTLQINGFVYVLPNSQSPIVATDGQTPS